VEAFAGDRCAALFFRFGPGFATARPLFGAGFVGRAVDVFLEGAWALALTPRFAAATPLFAGRLGLAAAARFAGLRAVALAALFDDGAALFEAAVCAPELLAGFAAGLDGFDRDDAGAARLGAFEEREGARRGACWCAAARFDAAGAALSGTAFRADRFAGADAVFAGAAAVASRVCLRLGAAAECGAGFGAAAGVVAGGRC
jgi:hypothetical protein